MILRRQNLTSSCREGEGRDQVRRATALAAVYDWDGRETAARIGGMDRQTLRDWGASLQ